jgi:transposase
VYRELDIEDVRNVLRGWQARQSARQSAKAAGVDRNTIGRYVKAAKQLGLDTTTRLTDEVVHQVARCVQSRPPREPSAQWNDVARHHDQIARWLESAGGVRPLELATVCRLLVRDHGLRASYDTLWRYARAVLGWRQKETEAGPGLRGAVTARSD